MRLKLIKGEACFTQGENVKISVVMYLLMVEVFEKMVTKMKLKRQKHPCPYCISWRSDDQKVMVNE